MPLDEKVLVIPTERFRAAGYFHGFRRADGAYRRAILDPSAFEFRPRYEVETDPAFKQLIPYIVLKCGETVPLPPRVVGHREAAAGAALGRHRRAHQRGRRPGRRGPLHQRA